VLYVRELNRRSPDLSQPLSDPRSTAVADILRLHDETRELVEETRLLLQESSLLMERIRRLEAMDG
jgi:hypothetical protein